MLHEGNEIQESLVHRENGMGPRLTCILVSWAVAVSSWRVHAAEIVTIAGTGVAGFSGDGGPALKAGLNQPFGLEIAPDHALYFCDYSNHAVRRIDLSTGLITSVAGTAGKPGYAGDGGPATQAMLHEPHEIRFDRDGNFFLSDTSSHAVRRVDAKTGVITTVAGTGKPGFSGDAGPATKALLDLPIAVSLDSQTGLFICDIKNHRIRRMDFGSGVISTFAGSGERKSFVDGSPVAGTALNGPRSLALDANNDVIIALREGNAVYRLKRKSMTLHHVAGAGKQGYAGDGKDARQALLSGPKGLAVDRDGNILLCDTENNVIRIIDQSTGNIETLIGDGHSGDGPDGEPRGCQLNRPHGIFVDHHGVIYIGDSGNNKVRKFVR